MLRGFSNFEAMFRKKMAKAAPVEMLQMKNAGLSEQEVADYKQVFNKFDKDNGGSIDVTELGNLVRVLGFVTFISFFLGRLEAFVMISNAFQLSV